MVKNRAKLHHEKPCKEKCKENNFAQNPHENKITMPCNDKSNPSDDLRLWKYFRHRWKWLSASSVIHSPLYCIAKFSANVSHPPSLHAVWKTVSGDEVAEHSLKRFGSLPFIGGGCYLRPRCKCKAQIWHWQKTWHIKSKKSIAAMRQIDDWNKP